MMKKGGGLLSELNLKFINIVWFKKDLRSEDHRPLLESMSNGPTVGLFIIEDEWLNSAEYSHRHLHFALESLNELKLKLAKLGVPLLVKVGEAMHVFNELNRKCKINTVFSHEETGLDWTYKRDKKFKSWCLERSIVWKEYPQFAVIRGLKNRDLWNQKRNKLVARAPIVNKNMQSYFKQIEQKWDELPFTISKNTNIQRGGNSIGIKNLHSFLYKRGENYTKDMSTPVMAFKSCSRISPHLSWGTISLPQVHSELSLAKSRQNSRAWSKSYKSFESRLWWHCHFIQKLESEPEIEFFNLNRGFDGMRENSFNESYFEAWKKGQTGFPIIDACMRALIKTGWINFRMRALLISFASYHLWLHWRRPAQYLASLFTDFEPGIHFSQIQMQSGVTGINTIRIYSPVKQAEDQDPNAVFIKQYCPELLALPDKQALAPSMLTPMEQIMYDFKLDKDYPVPIVDHKKVYNEAKDKIFLWRNKLEVKKIAKRVYLKHGSRKNSHFPNQHRKAFGNFSK